MPPHTPLWRSRDYWLLLLGTGVSGLGDQIYAFVLLAEGAIAPLRGMLPRPE